MFEKKIENHKNKSMKKKKEKLFKNCETKDTSEKASIA